MSLQEITIVGDWHDLPEDFLEQIAEYLDSTYDVELIGIGRSPWEIKETDYE